MLPRIFLFGLISAFIATASGCLSPTERNSPQWIAAWVSAQQVTEPHNLPPAPGLAGRTLRQVIQPSVTGQSVRVVVSNELGSTPLVLTSAAVAQSTGGSAIAPGSSRGLTFTGRRGVIIQPGTRVWSDPVGFVVTSFSNLAVSLYLQDVPEAVTGHPGSRTTSYILEGDHLTTPQLDAATAVDRWYLLSSVEVLAAPNARAIVVIGDSITDGRGSTTNANDRWPNLLARRLHAAGATHVSLLNQGVGGGRVLRHGLGLSALARFDRDVLAPPGVDTLVIFEGVNDIGSAVGARRQGEAVTVADDLIAAYQQMIHRAHSHGLRVIGATIMPFGGFESYDTPESESDRQKVNAWIRNSGAFDAVVDFDAIARDPQKPSRLAPAFDGGDHLHPSAEGYRLMAEAIDLTIFDL